MRLCCLQTIINHQTKTTALQLYIFVISFSKIKQNAESKS